MDVKRSVLLVIVLMISFMLKDMVVPRECIEALVDRWIGTRSEVVARDHSDDAS